MRGESPLFVLFTRAKVHRYDRIDREDDEEEEDEEAKGNPEYKAFEVMDRLGADFFAHDSAGRGLLSVAATGDAPLFKRLMEKGLEPMLENEDRQTALDVAAACNSHDILALFEKKKQVALRTKE